MANLHDYFFRQRVTELELDEGFEYLELADRDLCIDWDFPGVAQGAAVTEQGVPDLTVDVSGGVAYSKQGERISIEPTSALDLSVDENSVSTEPGAPGNSLVISIFVEFARDLGDPRIDGNSAVVFFDRFESFNFVIRKGAEAASPTPGNEETFINTNGSALDPNLILIADVLRANGQTQLTNSDIYLTRRENTFKLTAGSLSLDAGTAKQAVQAMLQELENHITDVANAHDADAVAYDPTVLPVSPDWVATNAATQVQAAIDGMITDLPSSYGGFLVGFDPTNLPVPAAWSAVAAAAHIQGATDGIIADLGQTAAPSGASLIGVDPVGALVGTDVQTILAGEVGLLAGSNTWTGTRNRFESAFEVKTHANTVAWQADFKHSVKTFAREFVVAVGGLENMTITGAADGTLFGGIPDTCLIEVQIHSLNVVTALTDSYRKAWLICVVERNAGAYTVANVNVILDYSFGVKIPTNPDLIVSGGQLTIEWQYQAAAVGETAHVGAVVSMRVLPYA